jgi:acyl-homoserine lactone acylase PvdQ
MDKIAGITIRFFLLCSALSCAGAVSAQADLDKLARDVTIYRDVYGVPHVFGRTDASTVFGFAYAQAEDNFWRIEENYIAAIGRSAEVYGERTLERDRRNRALEIQDWQRTNIDGSIYIRVRSATPLRPA